MGNFIVTAFMAAYYINCGYNMDNILRKEARRRVSSRAFFLFVLQENLMTHRTIIMNHNWHVLT
jgi:hypothetical protein